MTSTDDLCILVDENIRRGRAAFSGFGEVRSMSGGEISSEDLADVDILLVRSVTPVDEELLRGSSVQFVGSATAGTDHVDEVYLQKSGITFVHAPGSNADSVVEYVLAALLEVSVRRDRPLRGRTVGIVGCGQIGSRLVRRLPALGLEVLKSDPPLARQAEAAGQSHTFVTLERLVAEADVLTLHVPLTAKGPHATYHLIDGEHLAELTPSAWLINTCRGPVVDNTALQKALRNDQMAAAILDVWEHEPEPERELIEQCALATPHIAGHSYDGKLAGTIMLYEALEEYLGISGGWDYESALELGEDISRVLEMPSVKLAEHVWLHRLVQQVYDIAEDDRRLRRINEIPPGDRGAYFAEMRRTYPERRSFSNFAVPASKVPRSLRRAVAVALDMQLQ